jgi:hypothetical protein
MCVLDTEILLYKNVNEEKGRRMPIPVHNRLIQERESEVTDYPMGHCHHSGSKPGLQDSGSRSLHHRQHLVDAIQPILGDDDPFLVTQNPVPVRS